MKKRKNSHSNFKIPPVVVKSVVLIVVTVLVGWGVCKATAYLFRNAGRFQVKEVALDPALTFLAAEDFSDIIGQSIFTADLKALQKKLTSRFPQVSDLKLSKRFPDRIFITAKQRYPFAQTRLRSKILTFDENGVVLSKEMAQDTGLPFVEGLKGSLKMFSLGRPLRGKEIFLALKILRAFESELQAEGSPSLSEGVFGRQPFSVERINVRNSSEIVLTLSNSVKVIIGREQIPAKIKMFRMVLAEGHLDLRSVKYVDLRFNEIVIGEK